MSKMFPKLKLGCKNCESKKTLENISFSNIKISEPTNNSSKIVTLKGGKKQNKNKGLF